MNKEKKILYIVSGIMFILLVSLFITGCGSDPVATVLPTATSVPVTPTQTPTNVPVNTPTPTPVKADISDHFSFNGYYDTFVDPNTPSLYSGKLIIQIVEKSSSNLSPITDYEIQLADNPDLTFIGGLIYQDSINDIPSDWLMTATSSLFQWQGSTALTKGLIYSLHVFYASAPANIPTIKLHVTGANNHTNLGYVIIPIIRHDNPGIIDIVTPIPPTDNNL